MCRLQGLPLPEAGSRGGALHSACLGRNAERSYGAQTAEWNDRSLRLEDPRYKNKMEHAQSKGRVSAEEIAQAKSEGMDLAIPLVVDRSACLLDTDSEQMMALDMFTSDITKLLEQAEEEMTTTGRGGGTAWAKGKLLPPVLEEFLRRNFTRDGLQSDQLRRRFSSPEAWHSADGG